jgi:RNase P subunit RPR2
MKKEKKKELQEIAKKRVEKLVNFVIDNSEVKYEDRKKVLELCLKIWKKYNLRNFSVFKRYFYCKNCKKVIIPGETARIRIIAKKNQQTPIYSPLSLFYRDA